PSSRRPGTCLPRPAPTANCPAASPTTTPELPPNRSDQASRLRTGAGTGTSSMRARLPRGATPAGRLPGALGEQLNGRPLALPDPQHVRAVPCRLPQRRIQRRRTTPMTPKLAGTAALVTGASSGIGAATARRLAQDGACVALVARRRDRLQALAADIENAGGTALAVEADITDRAQAEAAIKQAAGQFGRFDILVNNAGRCSWAQSSARTPGSGTA